MPPVDDATASLEAEAYCLFLAETLGAAAEKLDFEAAFEGEGEGDWTGDARERGLIQDYFCACISANFPDQGLFYRCLALFQARSGLLVAGMRTEALQLFLAASGRVVSSLFMDGCFRAESWCLFSGCEALAEYFPRIEKHFLDALNYELDATREEVSASLADEIRRVKAHRRALALRLATHPSGERDSELQKAWDAAEAWGAAGRKRLRERRPEPADAAYTRGVHRESPLAVKSESGSSVCENTTN